MQRRDLTVSMCVDMCRAFEATTKQLKVMTEEKQVVSAVKTQQDKDATHTRKSTPRKLPVRLSLKQLVGIVDCNTRRVRRNAQHSARHVPSAKRRIRVCKGKETPKTKQRVHTADASSNTALMSVTQKRLTASKASVQSRTADRLSRG